MKTTAIPRRTILRSSVGLGVDAQGGPVIDPTENVISLSEAGNKRQDDLRDLTKELFDAKISHIAELYKVAALHQRELDHAESERLDSIRQVDREDVNKTAAQALNAIQTLATTTSTTAETLRTQVATTALASQNQLATITGEINKRLSALELSLSEGKGKQLVADPQSEQLFQAVQTLLRNQATGAGTKQGLSLAWAALVGIVGLFVSALLIGGTLVTLVIFLNRTPSPAYVPAPAGTTLPAAPPQVPR